MKLSRIVAVLMVFAVGGMILISSEAYGTNLSAGDWININYPPSGYVRYGTAGPFTITDITVPLEPAFITFCVESNEYFSLPGDYFVGSISSAAIKGGQAVSDPLDSRTGYLYSKFLSGAYAKANSNDLQQVIWKIEGEYSGPLTSVGDAMLADADANAGTTSLWGVQVLNIYYNETMVDGKYINYAQDMLVYVPEPGILILLGIAMSAIGMASWRIRKL
jgi:hypothetical protein